jgi:archaellum component FlaF (FlaF/FlaG flagellin family)
MKILTCSLAFLSTLATAVAQTVTPTYEGATVSVLQPGLATDFIDFYGGNYDYAGQTSINDVYVNNNGTQVLTSDLTDFTINGGVVPGNAGNNPYSTITTPAGQTFLTGDVETNPGLAFAITPLDSSFNPASPGGFNFDNFNVYLMISNTGGTITDATVSIDPRYYSFGTNPAFGTNDVAVTDNIVLNRSGAEYIEFNIRGLGTADADALAANPSAPNFPDLVVSANFADGTGVGDAYIGGVSFESVVPEPSTWALLLAGGLGLLVAFGRRRDRSGAAA